MKTGRELLVSVARRAAHSKTIVHIAIKTREVCRTLIKYHCMEGIAQDVNGELNLIRTIAPEATVFVDVGANVGEWASLFLSHMNSPKQGLLYEPSLDAYAKLCSRFANSPLLQIANAAISDKEGDMPFFEEPNSGETSSLVPGFSSHEAVCRLVPVKTLDQEAQCRGLSHIDFLKIDAEGYDLHVLRGSALLLQEQRISVIQFEYNQPWMAAGSTLNGAYALLRSCNYEVYLLKSHGLFTFDPAYYGEWFSYANFVAVAPASMYKVKPLTRGTL